MSFYGAFTGVVTMIRDFWTEADAPSGCVKRMTLLGSRGETVNFVVAPDTYFVDHAMLKPGSTATGFYDLSAPVPMIYPPQYVAVVMAKTAPGRNVTVDYFDDRLVSSDGALKLSIGPRTAVVLENGQSFNGSPADRVLTVVYGITTRSLPAQTTPQQVVVMCPPM